MDEAHLWAALRYLERNPVRAGLVEQAEDHAWSSAQCHLTGRDRLRLVDMEFWADAGGAEPWKALLASSAEEQWEMRCLERATYAGKPLGVIFESVVMSVVMSQAQRHPATMIVGGMFLAPALL